MAYQDYVKNITQQNQKALTKKLNAINTNADNNVATINSQYDNQGKILTEQYEAQKKETSDSYESALRTNEVQKLINERAVARRSAELGLTDSGLNRTQQTAVQLSYGNQKGDLELQRQKAVATLAATMRAKMADIENNRSSAITQIETNRNNSLMQAESDFNSFVQSQAAQLYNADLQAEAKKKAARIEAEKKELAKKEAREKVDYSAIKSFRKEILSEDEFKKSATHKQITRGRRGNIGNGGERYTLDNKTYTSYIDYVKSQLKEHYETFGTINEGTLSYLLDYYKIT